MRTRRLNSLAADAEPDAEVDMARTQRQPTRRRGPAATAVVARRNVQPRPALSESSSGAEQAGPSETSRGHAEVERIVEEAPAQLGGSSEAGEAASRPDQPMNWSQRRLQDDAALQLQKAKNEELKLKLQVRAPLYVVSCTLGIQMF